MRLAVVVPAFDEAATVGEVARGARAAVAELVRAPADGALACELRVIVVDGGSRDATAAVARAAGAEVVLERRRGYGRACATGVARATDADVIAFLDAGGTVDPADLGRVVAPILRGEADLVLGARASALRPWQRLGNRLATALVARRFGRRFADLPPLRAVRGDALAALDLRERGHGWPIEMQIAALAAGLRIVEVPVTSLPRRAGRSKVSGSARGAVRAGATILRVALTARRGATPPTRRP